MLKRRLFSLTIAAITVVSATMIATLATTGASATTTAVAASSHSGTAGKAAAATHGTGVFRIIHRGLVKDCVDIELTESGTYIAGNGVNRPVSLEDSGNCFNLYNEFTYDGHTGYQYQNGDGHCLWVNETSLTLELGVACQAGLSIEDFYGTQYLSGYGWEVSNQAENSRHMFSTQCEGSGLIDEVDMTSGSTLAACSSWNFPSG